MSFARTCVFMMSLLGGEGVGRDVMLSCAIGSRGRT
jgi:hypothetical protein